MREQTGRLIFRLIHSQKQQEDEKMRVIVKGALLSGLILGVALAGCSPKIADVKAKEAIAVMNPTEDSTVRGVVSFTKDGKGVRIIANIEGLSPGPHGFHIHEFGNCTSPDANSAGGHFNPTDMPHAGPKSEKRHVGDLGNLEADKNGLATLEWTDNIISLEGPESVIGRSVIVHAQADDFKTQPTGGSGARVACGVIGIAK
jgi:Cu-Zn family superoxide dismutase